MARELFSRPTLEVAQLLLGSYLHTQLPGRTPLWVRLVETEAYLQDDPASHSYRGCTARNQKMFDAGGTCYVYLCYGINYCMNVVTGPKGVGEAVLLRAAEPVTSPTGSRHAKIFSGPGRLTRELGVDLSLNGASFQGPELTLFWPAERPSDTAVGASPRIGISKATDLPYRFFLKDSPAVSRFRGPK